MPASGTKMSGESNNLVFLLCDKIVPDSNQEIRQLTSEKFVNNEKFNAPISDMQRQLLVPKRLVGS